MDITAESSVGHARIDVKRHRNAEWTQLMIESVFFRSVSVPNMLRCNESGYEDRTLARAIHMHVIVPRIPDSLSIGDDVAIKYTKPYSQYWIYLYSCLVTEIDCVNSIDFMCFASDVDENGIRIEIPCFGRLVLKATT